MSRLESFQCRRCNACCRQPGYVYLKEGEAEAIAGFLKMDLYDFTNQFCELLDRRQIVLKKNPDESCIFLNDKGCQIQTVKPQQCIDFPVKWNTPRSFEYCQGLKELFPEGFPRD